MRPKKELLVTVYMLYCGAHTDKAHVICLRVEQVELEVLQIWYMEVL